MATAITRFLDKITGRETYEPPKQDEAPKTPPKPQKTGIEQLRDKDKDSKSKTDKALEEAGAMKKGGRVKKYARGGGVEVRGKTKGRFV